MIGTVIETMPDYVDHIVIVDDCSPDDTSGAVERSRRRSGHADPPRGESGRGRRDHHRSQGRARWHWAATSTSSWPATPRWIPPTCPQLLDPVTDGRLRIREGEPLLLARVVQGMPGYRVFGNIVLSFMTKLASGYWHLFDPQNGYTAIRSDVLSRVPLDRDREALQLRERPADPPQHPAGARRRRPDSRGLRRRGVQHQAAPRRSRSSSAGSPSASGIASGTATSSGRSRRSRCSCSWDSLLFGFGVIVSIWLIFQIAGSVIATAATVMLAALPLMLGTQLLISALQLDIQATPSTPTYSALRRGRHDVRGDRR